MDLTLCLTLLKPLKRPTFAEIIDIATFVAQDEEMSHSRPTAFTQIFGGTLLKKSHAKTARPLNKNKALLLVLKSDLAGSHFLENEKLLRNLALKLGRRFGVKVYKFKALQNQIQLLLRFKTRRSYLSFVRSFSGLIARKTLQAERARPQIPQMSRGFWDQRPFSLIVSWGPQFKKWLSHLQNFTAPLIPFGFLAERFVKMPSQWIRSRILSTLPEFT